MDVCCIYNTRYYEKSNNKIHRISHKPQITWVIRSTNYTRIKLGIDTSRAWINWPISTSHDIVNARPLSAVCVVVARWPPQTVCLYTWMNTWIHTRTMALTVSHLIPPTIYCMRTICCESGKKMRKKKWSNEITRPHSGESVSTFKRYRELGNVEL